MPAHTHLKTIRDAFDPAILKRLEENVADFFRWGFIEAGGFVDVPVDTPGTVVGDEALLPAHVDGYSDFRVWQSIRAGWCYESGLDRTDEPHVCSGVYVNGVLRTSGFFVNFPAGRVVFDAPLAESDVVQAHYSYRHVSLYDQDAPWYRDVVSYTDVDLTAAFDAHRIPQPLIVVEGVPSRRLKGAMIGSGALRGFFDILYHVIAPTKRERDALVDAITLQQDKGILLYDTETAARAGKTTLGWGGSLRPGGLQYPELLLQYPGGQAEFGQCSASAVSSKLPLWRATARVPMEVVVGP